MNPVSILYPGDLSRSEIPRGISDLDRSPYRSADCKGTRFSGSPSYLAPVM